MLRNPDASGWPRDGERTEFRDVAEEWVWAYVRRLQGKTYRRQTGQPEPGPRLHATLERWLEHRRHTVTPNSLKGDVTVANHLRRTFGDVEVSHLDLQAWADHLAAREYRPATIRQYVQVARGMMDYAGAEPPDVTVRREGSMGVRAWSDAELVALRRAADSLGMRERFERAVCTGARRNELMVLRWEDFSPTNKSVLIARQLARTGTDLRPPKGKRIRSALVLPEYWTHHRPGATGPIEDPMPSVPKFQADFRALVEAAGLEHVGDAGWHSCRHLYSRIFLEHHGGDLMELSRYLGHQSIRTTEEYYGHFSQSAAIRRGRQAVYGEG